MPEPMGEGTLRAEAAGRQCDKMGEYFLLSRPVHGYRPLGYQPKHLPLMGPTYLHAQWQWLRYLITSVLTKTIPKDVAGSHGEASNHLWKKANLISGDTERLQALS